MAETPTPVFLCFKWGKGYPCKYTNILFRALSPGARGYTRYYG